MECANGEVAELILATTGAELRALVTDIQLDGGMSGVELAQYAKRNPEPQRRDGVGTRRALGPARHPPFYEAL